MKLKYILGQILTFGMLDILNKTDDNIVNYDHSSFIFHERNSRWGTDIIYMEKEGKAVGRLYMYNDDEETAYIEGLYVSIIDRMNGIGGSLLNILLSKCKQIGVKQCMLWCYKDEWVYEWYKRLGFEYYEDYKEENAVWLIKKLK